MASAVVRRAHPRTPTTTRISAPAGKLDHERGVRRRANRDLAVHAGQDPDEATSALLTPIYANSTYEQDAPGEHRGYEYSRPGNPTRTDLEANLAALEGGSY